MKSPFLFGKIVSAEGFTNRNKDIQRLKDNFSNQVNTIIISPRRWGKSSLVKKVTAAIQNSHTKTVLIDMMGIRNEEDFYKTFATATIRATHSKTEEWIAIAKQFLKQLSPKISIGSDPIQEFEISFDWKTLEKNYRDILNLPERLALQKKIRIVICIDEFQNLANFNEPELFQKRLRSEWQHHTHVCYCLYGSRQHMMTELFTRQSKAFYKFGELMYLDKIDTAEWVTFIVQQFEQTKKKISPELAMQIAVAVKNHSYYVQQLSHLVWIKTNKTATADIVEASITDLLDQNAILYSRDTENLTGAQFNFLKALAQGINSLLSSKNIINQYQLGTSANVLKIKKALIQKELIEEAGGKIEFADPAYEMWFQRYLL